MNTAVNVMVFAVNLKAKAMEWQNPKFSYRVEVAKTTAAPLVAKFGVKAGGDSNANRAMLLVF